MIDTDKYEGHTEGPWLATHDTLENEMGWVINHDGWRVWVGEKETDVPHLENNRFGSENLNEADARLIADAPLLLEFIQKAVKDWCKPNQCNKAFGKDVRQLMYEYGLITYNEETMRYEVKKND